MSSRRGANKTRVSLVVSSCSFLLWIRGCYNLNAFTISASGSADSVQRPSSPVRVAREPTRRGKPTCPLGVGRTPGSAPGRWRKRRIEPLPASQSCADTQVCARLAQRIGGIDDSAVAQAVRRLANRIQVDASLARASKASKRGQSNVISQDLTPFPWRVSLPR
jgi:hypothetical protein